MKKDFDRFVKDDLITVSDISFVNMFAWDGLRKYELSELNENVVITTNVKGKKEFVCPIIANERKAADTIIKCLEHLKQKGHEPVMRFVSEEIKNMIKKDKVSIEEDVENSDYVYKISDLINLEGKQYSSKRNDISHVMKDYRGQYRLLMHGMVRYCKNFERAWYRRRMREEPSFTYLDDEHKACLRVLDNYSKLKLCGSALFLNGVVRGFTICDRMSSNMVTAHFEKGDRNIRGT